MMSLLEAAAAPPPTAPPTGPAMPLPPVPLVGGTPAVGDDDDDVMSQRRDDDDGSDAQAASVGTVVSDDDIDDDGVDDDVAATCRELGLFVADPDDVVTLEKDVAEGEDEAGPERVTSGVFESTCFGGAFVPLTTSGARLKVTTTKDDFRVAFLSPYERLASEWVVALGDVERVTTSRRRSTSPSSSRRTRRRGSDDPRTRGTKQDTLLWQAYTGDRATGPRPADASGAPLLEADAASVIGSAAPRLVGHVAGAEPACAGPLPGPARSPAAGPRRRVLGRRPPAPGRRSGRRRRPRAVRGAPPRPRRGTRALRRPAQALGPLGPASAVSARRRNDARAGPPARGRVELRRPAHGTIAYIRALDGMAARRAAAPPGLLPGCPRAPDLPIRRNVAVFGARAPRFATCGPREVSRGCAQVCCVRRYRACLGRRRPSRARGTARLMKQHKLRSSKISTRSASARPTPNEVASELNASTYRW